MSGIGGGTNIKPTRAWVILQALTLQYLQAVSKPLNLVNDPCHALCKINLQASEPCSLIVFLQVECRKCREHCMHVSAFLG